MVASTTQGRHARTRTRLLAPFVLASAVVAFAPLATPQLPVDPNAHVAATSAEGATRLILDITDAIDRTTLVTPQSLGPLPPAVNLGPGTKLIISRPDGTFLCTANFIWTAGSTTYLGAAGHCFLPEGKTATHGPGADYNPALTTTRACVTGCSLGGILGGSVLQGTLVTLGSVAYARQTQGGVDIGNDFGIVTIQSSLANRIRPTMPVWGGPHGSQGPTFGAAVALYGNGIIVGETFATMARAGVDIDGFISDPSPDMWEALVPSQGGDSGSGVLFLKADTVNGPGGPALGILTHALIGVGTDTFGTTIAKAKTMATQAGLNINLVDGA